MKRKISSALISVFYKDGLEPLVKTLHNLSIKIYSTGGTQTFIENLGVPCIAVESLTNFPSILGGRVKTLHPLVFGGILGKRSDEIHISEMQQFGIPEIDLVIVDLYPFEETVKATNDEKLIIEKIDIGGPSMLRAAAKNFNDVVVISSKENYDYFEKILIEQNGETTLDQRRELAVQAFDVCTSYDNAISNYFHSTQFPSPFNKQQNVLRYGENPHQQGIFFGNLNNCFNKLHGKDLSYNNLVDVEAAIKLLNEFTEEENAVFLILKHTNVCGIALRDDLSEAWKAALKGDAESAFGGVLCCNQEVDAKTASLISEIFFEVLIAPSFNEEALEILKVKKNRVLLQLKTFEFPKQQMKTLLNGILVQDNDFKLIEDWKEEGGRESNSSEKKNLILANIVAKHLKSNSISLVKDLQLIGKGCGQTSRVDALRQALQKAGQSGFDVKGSVIGSDAFFPFDDCVKIAFEAGVSAFIQPGGSVRDSDSINFCKENNLVMVLTGVRHFNH